MTKNTALLSAAAAVILMNPCRTVAQFNPAALQAVQAAQQAANAVAVANALAAAQAAGAAAGQMNVNPQASGLPLMAGVPTASATPGPKKAGTVRIGIALPQSQASSAQFNAREELRNEWIQLLTGPNVEPVRIMAGLPQQAVAEAKLTECDYIVFSTLSQKTDNNGMKKMSLFHAASSMIPMAGMASGMAGMVATTAAQTAMASAGEMGSMVKAKQEVSLQYSLVAVENGQSVVQSTASAKAAQDGQDVITPLVTQAAGAMISKVQLTRPAA